MNSENTHRGNLAEQTNLDKRLPDAQLLLKDRALSAAAEGITIADARLPDLPLIYANAGFERLTGYRVQDVLGTNCRFLQGKDSDPAASAEIRRALDAQRECVVEILNYRKDGSTFWNRLSITPVRSDAGELTHFIGIQTDVTDRRRAEDELRQANLELEQNNRRMIADLDAAARIQQSLLPVHLPQIEKFRLAWTFRPCDELAGDTLNVIPLGDERFGIFVIDVSGHGIRAALLSVTLSHTLSADPSSSCLFVDQSHPSADRVAPPSLVASRLNRQFQMDLQLSQYFTMLYGVLNTRSRSFEYVSAGHPPAVLLSATGEPRLLTAVGFPIGLIENADYKGSSVQLSPGDRLFMYTDGVVEAAHGGGEEEPFGEDRLVAEVLSSRHAPLQECVENIRGKVEQWCDPGAPGDDLSVMAIEAIT